jgi:hypothetical protein
MDNTIIQQGVFVSTGANQPIILRSDVDWMHVYNWTQSVTNNINRSVEHWWQRELPVGEGICYYHVAATQALSSNSAMTLSGGIPAFGLFDTSANPYSANRAITRIPANGVVLTANTAGLAVGSVVRFNNVTLGLQHCNDMLYSVTAVNPGVSFTIVPALNNVDTGVIGPNCFYQIVAWPELYYPRDRKITNITQAINAQVTTAIPHGMTVGQQVRFSMPRVTALAYGMLQLDGMTANVVAVVDAWNYLINIGTTAMGAFAFPLTADIPFTYAQMIPLGEDTRTGLLGGADILADATVNVGSIGILLFAGAYGPAGLVGDEIKWVAGKSFATFV